jgi:hypothetical protein
MAVSGQPQDLAALPPPETALISIVQEAGLALEQVPTAHRESSPNSLVV